MVSTINFIMKLTPKVLCNIKGDKTTVNMWIKYEQRDSTNSNVWLR